MNLDQFYTKAHSARDCWGGLQKFLRDLTGSTHDLFFVEPSAGTGSFYSLLPPRRRLGLDLEPRCGGVSKADFLTWGDTAQRLGSYPRERIVVVGNPPFGKRGSSAVEFFIKAASVADTIAFIVPVVFRKYSIHRQLPMDLRFACGMPLPQDSFETSSGKPYAINTEFQIWTKLPLKGKYQDKRLHTQPPISHGDFDLHQYNNTKEARKVFEKPFNFAVPCQGWQDYERRERRVENCELNKQWMLFSALRDWALEILRDLDYNRLAHENGTVVPGFRKYDVVREYEAVRKNA